MLLGRALQLNLGRFDAFFDSIGDNTCAAVVPISPTAVPELPFFTCTKTCWYAPAVEVILDAPSLA